MVHQRTAMIESLEPRQLLAITAPTAEPHVVNTPVGLTPQQVRHAYNVDKIWYKKKGKLIRGTGEGQTIAIVDAYDHPRITSDFKIFNKQFGLPNYGKDGKLLLQKKVAPGKFFTAAVPPVDRGWAGEIALDVEWAHVIAPRAKIILVEAQSAAFDDLLAAVDFARNIPGVSTISCSWGNVEQGPWQDAFNNFFTTPKGHIGSHGLPGGITFIFSSGDDGGVTSWPAVSENVLAVGGTNLKVDAVGNVLSETAWTGSGGGPPLFSYPNNSPDVSMVADPQTGVGIYNSIPDFSGQSGWSQIGGTSASAPMWAGLLAIANEGRAILGKPNLDGVKDVLPWLATYPSNNFRDIVTGFTSSPLAPSFEASPGLDPVTGIGSPKAHKVMRALILWDTPSTPVIV